MKYRVTVVCSGSKSSEKIEPETIDVDVNGFSYQQGRIEGKKKAEQQKPKHRYFNVIDIRQISISQ